MRATQSIGLIETVREFLKKYMLFSYDELRQYHGSPDLKQAIDEKKIFSNRSFEEGINYEMSSVVNWVEALNLMDLPIVKALNKMPIDNNVTFLEVVTGYYSTTKYLKERADLINSLTAEALNRSFLVQSVTDPNAVFNLSPIANILEWQAKGVDLLLCHNEKLLPLVDPIVFKRSPKENREGAAVTQNYHLLGLIYMGTIGFSYIKNNRAVLESITSEQINQYLYCFLQNTVARRVLANNPQLLAMITEPNPVHRRVLLSIVEFIPGVISNLTSETMLNAGYQKKQFSLVVNDSNVNFTIKHADKAFIARLQIYIENFFTTNYLPMDVVYDKSNNVLKIKGTLFDFAQFIKMHEKMPSQLSDIPLIASDKKNTKKKNKKTRKKHKENQDNIIENIVCEDPPEQCDKVTPPQPKIKQKFNAALWQTGLKQFFGSIEGCTIKSQGAKDKNTFHFIANLPESKYLIMCDPKNKFSKFKVNSNILHQMIINKLQEYDAMTMELHGDEIHIEPKQQDFTPSGKSLSNFFNQVLTENKIEPGKPYNKPIRLPEKVKQVFDSLQPVYGYPIFLGSSLEDCVKEQLFKQAKTEENAKKDIDVVIFAKEETGLDNFVRNENANFSLYNANQELKNKISTHVDLLFVDSNIESIKDNILKRDFVHCTVFANSKGEIFDLTGRGLDAIKNNRLTTVRDPKSTFEEDPVCLLRAIKFMLQGKIPDEATDAAIRNWSRQNSKLNMQRISNMLKSHLLKYDPDDYVKKLKEYGLVEKLFGINLSQPNWYILRELRRKHANILEISKDLTTYCSMVPKATSRDNCFYVEEVYTHPQLKIDMIKTTDHMIFPIDPATGLPVAKDELDHLFYLQVPFIPKEAKNISTPQRGNMNQETLHFVRKYQKDGMTYIQERISYDYPLDVTGRPFDKDDQGKFFLVDRMLNDLTSSTGNNNMFQAATSQLFPQHAARNTEIMNNTRR